MSLREYLKGLRLDRQTQARIRGGARSENTALRTLISLLLESGLSDSPDWRTQRRCDYSLRQKK